MARRRKIAQAICLASSFRVIARSAPHSPLFAHNRRYFTQNAQTAKGLTPFSRPIDAQNRGGRRPKTGVKGAMVGEPRARHGGKREITGGKWEITGGKWEITGGKNEITGGNFVFTGGNSLFTGGNFIFTGGNFIFTGGNLPEAHRQSAH